MGLKKFLRKVAPYSGLIGAAADLVGGVVSNKRNRRAADVEYDRQKEFAQMGIRWKVDDAKAAGLHPLFALGAQTPSYNPVAVQDSVGPALASAGQNISRAVAATQTAREREAAELALKLARGQVTEQDLRNEGLRLDLRERQNADILAPVFPGELPFGGPDIDLGGSQDSAIRRATVFATPSDDPSVAAGETPLWRVFRLGKDTQIVLPGGMGGDAAEVLESLGDSKVMLAAVYAENVRRFGTGPTDRLFRSFGLTPPSERRGPIARLRRYKQLADNTYWREKRGRAPAGSGAKWKQVR